MACPVRGMAKLCTSKIGVCTSKCTSKIGVCTSKCTSKIGVCSPKWYAKTDSFLVCPLYYIPYRVYLGMRPYIILYSMKVRLWAWLWAWHRLQSTLVADDKRDSRPRWCSFPRALHLQCKDTRPWYDILYTCIYVGILSRETKPLMSSCPNVGRWLALLRSSTALPLYVALHRRELQSIWLSVNSYALSSDTYDTYSI